MQIQAQPKVYDVAVIGSGAGGGMTGHVLTQAGLDVVMLEAGQQRSVAEFPVHKVRRWNLPYRGLRGDYFREWLDHTDWLVDEKREPYGWAGKDWFEWVRIRAVGGKSLFWAGVTPRFGPNEFQPKDDWDTRWPVTYADIEPYYDRVEDLIGVSGSEAVGGFPGNKGLAPFKPKCAEIELKRAAESLPGRGLKVVPIPKGILSQNHRGRPACHYCGPCWLGCDSGSKFDSLRTFVLGAKRTGKLTLMTGARVRSLELGGDGKVKSVHYWDVKDKTYREVRAKQFVLAAGCIESAQILLNSPLDKSRPGATVANSSGNVGRYLSEHQYADVGGYLPQLMKRPVRSEDGNGAHVIIPDLTENWRGNKFIRGYQMFPTGGIGDMTLVGKNLPGFGQRWKESVRDYYPAAVSVLMQGEVLPYRDNRIEVDESLKDDAGIPGVRFHYAWHDNERKMFEDFVGVGNEILREAGAEVPPGTQVKPLEYGHSIHYVGTARMGTDPKTSVTTPYSQCHDVPNLSVHDAGPFVTAGNQNPTLTILAFALRSSEKLAERMRKGEV